MSESFVDLTYRGLPLGRRVKLTHVRPSTGYLELPHPMPVGTQLAIATDEGLAIDATVTQVHEQTSGGERPPGMLVTPALGGEAAAAWWRARVALPELEAPPEPRGAAVTLHPRTRSATIPTPPPPAEGEGAAADDVTATAPMPVLREDAGPALDQRPTLEMAPLGGGEPGGEPGGEAGGEAGGEPGGEPGGEVDAAGEIDGPGPAEPPLVDDGKRTIMMHSMDLSALGLEASASGTYRAIAPDAGGDGDGDGDGAPGGGRGRRDDR